MCNALRISSLTPLSSSPLNQHGGLYFGSFGDIFPPAPGEKFQVHFFSLSAAPAAGSHRFLLLSGGKSGAAKLKNLVKNACWWKAPRKDGDAPEQALILAPINCWLLSEPERALRERDLGCETAEMGYPLVQLAADPKPGCCRVCKVLPGRASCQETVLPVLPAPRSCLRGDAGAWGAILHTAAQHQLRSTPPTGAK